MNKFVLERHYNLYLYCCRQTYQWSLHIHKKSKQSKDNEVNSVNKGATNYDVGGVENSPSAGKVNTDSDPFDEGNSPSAVKVNTDSDPFDEGNSRSI